jgi:hypothetical protein
VTDINVFVRLSRRNTAREAVGLARMRQQVKAGKLKVAWMSEEEKAAYRLQEAPEAGATVASDPGEYEPGEGRSTERSRAHARGAADPWANVRAEADQVSPYTGSPGARRSCRATAPDIWLAIDTLADALKAATQFDGNRSPGNRHAG